MIPIPPSWIVGGGVAAVLLGLLGLQHKQKADLREEIARARGETADCRVANAQLEANRDKVVAELENQTRAIAAFKREADAAAAEQADRLKKALEDSRRSREVRVRAGAGPAEMNRWLAATFPSP